MKEIRITLEDQEYEKVLKQKGEMTWKEYFMEGGEKNGNNDTAKE